MSKKKKTILAISSGGGHWVQLLRLRPAFEEHTVVFATTKPGYRADVSGHAFRVVPDCNRWEKFKLLKCCLSIVRMLISIRPDVVVSTGAAPGFFGLRLGKLFGAKTCWVDSVANAEELSLSGQKIGPYAGLWLTQWEHLARPEGPHFSGNVLGSDDSAATSLSPADAVNEGVSTGKRSETSPDEPIFVTVGTDLPFDRLVRAVDDWAAASQRRNVFAQIGNGSYQPRFIEYSPFLEPPQFQEKFKNARLIISHAGMGTILSSLYHQKSLLVMPRIAAKGEHRNEHQLATVKHLEKLDKLNIAEDENRLCALLESIDALPVKGRIGAHASEQLINRLREFIAS